jgi:hypothetical protein
MAARKKKNQDVLDEAIGYYLDCQDFHQDFLKGVKQRSDAYHAMKDVKRDPSYMGWRNAHFAPYVQHIVDSTLASMVEDRIRFTIKARPTLEDLYDPTYAETVEKGAHAHQILMDWQNSMSKFTRMQRPFLLQNAIAKLTVAKTYWFTKEERRKRLVVEEEHLLDDFGEPIIDHVSGMPRTTKSLKTETRAVTVYDGPMTEVIDIFDWGWEKGATSLQNAHYVWHRTWASWDELESEFGDDGGYGPDNGGWTLKQVRDVVGSSETPEDTDTNGTRWSQKENTHDWKRLEVVELWNLRTKEVTTFVGRRALLAHKQFPFFHNDTPFTVCTTQPDLFSFTGISQVEKVQALQELLWKIQNQSVDNLELINNAIVIFNPALESASSLQFYPGAAWPVEDPELVKMWSPNPMPAEISLNREGLLKGDMQNVAATFPFSSGAESQTVDQKTATGASIVSNLAQRSIDMAKQPMFEALQDIGQQRLILNQQFIRQEMAIPVIGLSGKEEYEELLPELLAGDYHYELEPMPDALAKQAEQAKATAMLQVFGQLAPIVLPLAQGGAAKMINFDKVIEHYLRANDIDNPQQFFIEKPPAASLQPQGGQAPPGASGPGGITGEGSISPDVSPSAMISQSPETAGQRLQALQGGGQSVGS